MRLCPKTRQFIVEKLYHNVSIMSIFCRKNFLLSLISRLIRGKRTSAKILKVSDIYSSCCFRSVLSEKYISYNIFRIIFYTVSAAQSIDLKEVSFIKIRRYMTILDNFRQACLRSGKFAAKNLLDREITFLCEKKTRRSRRVLR